MAGSLTYKPISMKAFTEAAIESYNEEARQERVRNELEEINEKRRKNRNNFLYESAHKADKGIARKNSFIESVKASFLSDAIYKIYSESVRSDLADSNTSRTVMRCLISNFINENDINNILRNMRTGSIALSEVYNIIDKYTHQILESDEVKSGEFKITTDVKDDFYEALDYTDAGEISSEIQNRVTDAIADFVDTNNKEHDEIADTLSQAAEKVEEIDTGDEEKDEAVAESYNMIAKKKVNDIRNRRKNVFHTLVTNMAEHVIRHPDMHSEFMIEGKLNMPKIVDRIELLYTFMETMNTSRLVKVDENFIADTIKEMKK